MITISAKQLGALAMPDFCPRCFWVRMRVQHRLPYQIFPGVFASIDSFTKTLIADCCERTGAPPPWMSDLEIVSSMAIPHYSRFSFLHDASGVRLRGQPDALFRRNDGTIFIIDYKTSRFTQSQDRLLPLYKAQLNAYAVIAEECGFGRVSGIGLVYFEPGISVFPPGERLLLRQGFLMPFRAKLLELRLEARGLIAPLLHKVREIDLGAAPPSVGSCRDCAQLNHIITLGRHP